MHKIIRPGTIKHGGRYISVFCDIRFEDGKLSISGVEGPLPSGNALGSCGQIVMHMRMKPACKWHLAPGWTADTLRRFFAVWDRWHLNDMRAGSPVQEEWLRDNPSDPYDPYADTYKMRLAALTRAGLNPDADGYVYGSGWKREDVPEDVIAWLQALPAADRKPAWV